MAQQARKSQRPQLIYGLIAAASISLAACGGGGSSGSTGGGSPTPAAADPTARVSGPLDPVQSTLESSVFNPLANAVAGTPLAGVVDCGNEIINREVLDTVDTLAGALALSADPTDLTALQLGPELLTQRIRAVAFDVTQLVMSLSGGGTACLTQGNSAVFDNADALAFLSGENPLSGTPFESFAATLSPALAQLFAATGGAQPDGNLSANAVIGAYQQFNTAVQGAFAMLPAQVQDAPVVGGVLAGVGTALGDLEAVLTQLAVFDATGVQNGLTTLLSNLASNVTAGLVPLDMLDGLLGESGSFTALNSDAITDFSTLVPAQLFGGTTGSSPLALIQGVLDPVAIPVLGPIIDQLTSTLGSNPLGGGLNGDLLSNTPLAPVVDVIQTVLTGLLGSVPGTEGGSGELCLLFICIPNPA